MGLSSKFCAKRTDLFKRPHSQLKNAHWELEYNSLHFGKIGEKLTLFDCVIEIFVKIETYYYRSTNWRHSVLCDYIYAYEHPGIKIKEGKRLAIRKKTKLLIIREFKKIKCFLMKYQGNIILNFPQIQNFLKHQYLDGNYDPEDGQYILSEKKMFLEFSMVARSTLITELECDIKWILDVEDLEKEAELIDCASFYVTSNYGIQPDKWPLIPPYIQEQILYNLAPGLPGPYLREKFLPRKHRNNVQR